jgi:tetratricopeptide (TPR) repeat protein
MRMTTAILLFAFPVLGAAPVPGELSEAELREKALKLNKEATNEDSADKKLKELNKDKVGTPKLVAAAAKVLKDADAGKNPFRFYPTIVLAKAAYSAKEYDAAEVFFASGVKQAVDDLKSGKMIVLAYTSQIDFYYSRKKYDNAIKACEKFLDIDGDSVVQNATIAVLDKKLRAMAKNNQADAAIDEINRFIKRFRSQFFYRMIKASVQREAGKYDDAVDTYKQTLDVIANDGDIPDGAKAAISRSIRYSLSAMYSEMGKIEKAYEELEKLMKDDPSNPTYKNDLGFMWADNNIKLEEAEKLIREAVEMDLENNKKLLEAGRIDAEQAKKANPAYIDSLGWVLYRRGKYEEALKALLESAGSGDEESDHIEIWDHVGDCYLALNKKKEALAAFEKGLTFEDISKKDADRRKKVEAKIAKLKAELK